MHQYPVTHNIKKQRFEVTVDHAIAVLEYHMQSNTINFHRTFVPESLRGKTIALDLVDTGLTWAKAQQLTITTDCWFVEKVIKRKNKQSN